MVFMLFIKKGVEFVIIILLLLTIHSIYTNIYYPKKIEIDECSFDSSKFSSNSLPAIFYPKWWATYTLHKGELLHINLGVPEPEDPEIDGNYYQVLDNGTILIEGNWTLGGNIDVKFTNQLTVGYHNVTIFFVGTKDFQDSKLQYLIHILPPKENTSIPIEMVVAALLAVAVFVVIFKKYFV